MIEEIPTQIVDEAEIDFDEPEVVLENPEYDIHQQIDVMEFVPLVIGEFTFIIIGKVTLLHKSRSPYDGVVIQIKGDNEYDEYHTFYESVGQCGLYRLCLSGTPGTMYKGTDYIQSTCAHLLLQHYIFKFIDFVGVIVEQNYVKYGLTDNEFVGVHCTDDVSLYGAINNVERTKIKLFLNNQKNDQFNIPYFKLADYNNLPRYLLNFSKTFKEEYNIIGSDICLFEYTFIKHDIRFDCKVNQVQLSREAPHKTINLYYLEVFLSGGNPIIQRLNNYDVHLMPFLLTPNELTINNFGLYDKFFTASIFPGKLLDYTVQCSELEQQLQCTQVYAYVGNRFRNLYPFNELYGEREEEIEEEIEGVVAIGKPKIARVDIGKPKIARVAKKSVFKPIGKKGGQNIKISKKSLINIQTKKRLNTKLTKSTKKIKKNKSKKYGIRTM